LFIPIRLQLVATGSLCARSLTGRDRDDASVGGKVWFGRWRGLGAAALAGCIDPRPKDDVVTIRSALTGDFQESGGQVVMEAEHFTGNVPQGGHSWASENDANAAGGRRCGRRPTTPTNVDTGYSTGKPACSTFGCCSRPPGTYQVWVRGRAGGRSWATATPCTGGIDGAAIASADRINGFTASFGWTRAHDSTA
jgi:hypothetical protein